MYTYVYTWSKLAYCESSNASHGNDKRGYREATETPREATEAPRRRERKRRLRKQQRNERYAWGGVGRQTELGGLLRLWRPNQRKERLA